MDKSSDKKLVDTFDAICILNENYASIGIHTGYVGTVVENFIGTYGFVLADFDNPFKCEYIAVCAEIKQEDFRVLTDSLEDKLIVKKYKDLFRE